MRISMNPVFKLDSKEVKVFEDFLDLISYFTSSMEDMQLEDDPTCKELNKIYSYLDELLNKKIEVDN